MEISQTFKIRNNNYLTLSMVPILLIIIGFIMDTPLDIAKGLIDIVVAPDVLLTDYIYVGGIGAAFLNVGLVTFVGIYFIYLCKINLTGPLIAALFTLAGFAFIGKNIVNIWPIFLGGYLYTRYKKMEFGDILVPLLFATTLAPAVSEIAFGLEISYVFSIPLAIFVGIGIGFIVFPLSKQIVHFHDGYNLYNIGFTGGIIGILIASLLKGWGFVVETQLVLSTEYHVFLRNLLVIIFSLFIVLGFILNDKSFKGYFNVLKTSGRFLSDFVESFGMGLTWINFGIMGLVGIAYVMLVNGTFDGPVVAGIFTMAAFASFGKNPKNTIPIILGVYLGSLVKVFDTSSTGIIIAALFGTTLAPIAGTFGFIPGIIAGFLHLSVVSSVGIVHSGLNLYNNGFAGGIVAGIMSPMLKVFFENRNKKNG